MTAAPRPDPGDDPGPPSPDLARRRRSHALGVAPARTQASPRGPTVPRVRRRGAARRSRGRPARPAPEAAAALAAAAEAVTVLDRSTTVDLTALAGALLRSESVASSKIEHLRATQRDGRARRCCAASRCTALPPTSRRTSAR